MTRVPIPANQSLVKRSHVNFQPAELDQIKACIFRCIRVVARAFCESELTMLSAIRDGKVNIGTVKDYQGNFCIFIEYQEMQILKPVHAIH